jgi:hypothetical protein
MLGYCLVCEKLVPIRPGPFRWGSRERYWLPVAHEKPDGGNCPGDKKGI